METASTDGWRAAPRWLYWVAAPVAPAFIAVGAILCLGLSLVLGQEPVEPPAPRAYRRNR